MATKRGLNKVGGGLRALIDTGEDYWNGSKEGIMMVNISRLSPNKEQPRKYFDKESLTGMAESIKKHGVLSPLIVVDRGDYYQIVAGERRWRAAQIAGITEVPIIIKVLTEEEILQIAIIENLQREDLNAIDEASGLKELMERFDHTQDEVAEIVGKSRAYIANSIRLLNLSAEVQQLVIEKKISAGHARTLLGLEKTEEQIAMANRIINEKLSVRETEKTVKNYDKVRKVKKMNPQLSNVYKDIETKLKDYLSTKVCIDGKNNGNGEIKIQFYSGEDLERLIDLILRQ